MYYELMWTDTMNVFGEYDSLEDAYRAVLSAVAKAGDRVAHDLMLSEMQDDGGRRFVAAGTPLLLRSREGVGRHIGVGGPTL